MRTRIFLLSLLVAVIARPSVLIDGFYYDLDDSNNTATFTYGPYNDESHNYLRPYFGHINIPPKVTYENKNYDVVRIGRSAFLYCEEIHSISIPSSITSIDSEAFAGCTNITYISIPNSVNHIGSGIFYGCSKLSSVTLSENISYIPPTAFVDCISLDAINIPAGVDQICDNAFEGCKSITSIELNNNIDLIGKYAFKGCSGLKDVYCLGEKAPICDDSFLKEDVKETTLHVKDYAIETFKGVDPWTWFKEIVCDEKVTNFELTYYVDGEIYKNYKHKYEDTIIPEAEPIKKGMSFSGWSEIPPQMPAHDVTVTGTFSWSKLTKGNVVYEVTDTLNNSCRVIGNDNASGEIKIDSVEIDGYYYQPTEIANKAFYGCKAITKIGIPKTVVTIGERAFANIDKLTDITIWAEEVPTTDRTAFENSYIDYVTLHVPANSIDKYKSTAPWSGFKEIVAIEGTEPQEKCATPTIDYKDGKLVFECETDGAECITTITSADVDTHYGNVVEISYTYNISTYAKAEGYANSDLVTAMLVWIEQDETISVLNEEIEAKAVLVQAHDGTIWISGIELGTVIEVYNVAGAKIASINAQQGTTQITTTLNAGDIAIVKIGNRTVKVLMR